MLRLLSILAVSIFVCFWDSAQGAEYARPVKFYKGCEVDFDNNGFTDVAMLVQTTKGVELMVIMKNKSGGRAFLLHEGSGLPRLSCRYKESVNAIVQIVGENKKAPHTINAHVIVMIRPEAATWLYYWEGNGFSELWLSD